MDEFKVGDVVEVGGMRGIIREERNGRFRVSAGRTDEGVWVDTVDMVFMYREGLHTETPRPGDWFPVQTDNGWHLRLVGANGEPVLTSEVYTDKRQVDGAIALVAKTPPFLGPVIDERAKEGSADAGDDQDA